MALIAFLACRISSGNRLDTVRIANCSHMCPEEAVGGMVRELGIGCRELNPFWFESDCSETT